MEHVVVLGALGKMGRGIALLLLQEMAWKEKGTLTLVDVQLDGVASLKKYLKQHVKRDAEKSINRLRKKFADVESLIDNGDIIDAFVEKAMDSVRFVTSAEECKGADVVFEAVIEDVEIKAALLKEVSRYASPEAYFFSNTSSIPIHILSEKSGLNGRLIGFHFYNPPPVQKLVEVIIPENVSEDVHTRLKAKAVNMGKSMHKTPIYSRDIAGFIGNGYFIREILWACNTARRLQTQMTLTESISAVNKATESFLLRPMGIFQLIDYVGIDVCLLISKIMTKFLNANDPSASFIDPLIVSMYERGILAGQHPDGSQKDGFFKYTQGNIAGVYDMEAKVYENYKPIDRVGQPPAGCLPWKVLVTDKDREKKVDDYLSNLIKEDRDVNLGVEIANSCLKQSSEIIQGLIKDGVAKSYADVETVLKQGFYHLFAVKEVNHA